MNHFWNGFLKTAGTLGVKAIQPPGTTGSMEGNRPTSGVSTGSSFKPNALPTPKPAAANKNNSPALPQHKVKGLPKPIANKMSTHI